MIYSSLPTSKLKRIFSHASDIQYHRKPNEVPDNCNKALDWQSGVNIESEDKDVSRNEQLYSHKLMALYTFHFSSNLRITWFRYTTYTWQLSLFAIQLRRIGQSPKKNFRQPKSKSAFERINGQIRTGQCTLYQHSHMIPAQVRICIVYTSRCIKLADPSDLVCRCQPVEMASPTLPQQQQQANRAFSYPSSSAGHRPLVFWN